MENKNYSFYEQIAIILFSLGIKPKSERYADAIHPDGFFGMGYWQKKKHTAYHEGNKAYKFPLPHDFWKDAIIKFKF